MRELQQGDIIYFFKNNLPYKRQVVERVTKTQAITRDYKFKKQADEFGYVTKIPRDGGYFAHSFCMETSVIKEKFLYQKALWKVKSFDFKSLSKDRLDRIIKITEEVSF